MTEERIPSAVLRFRDWAERVLRVRAGVPDAEERELARELEEHLEAVESSLERIGRQRLRFEELFRRAPIAYLITDLEGLITDANDAAAALLGIAPDRLEGTRLAAYMSAASGLSDQLACLARSEDVDGWVTQLRPPDGHRIPVRMSATAAREPVSGEIEARWVVRDARPDRASRDRERHLHREQAARGALEQVAARARFLSEASARLMGILDADAVWAMAADLAASYADGVVLLERTVEDTGRLAVRATRAGTGMGSRLHDLHEVVVDLDGSEAAAGILPIEAMGTALRLEEPVVAAGAAGQPEGAGVLVLPIAAEQRIAGLMAVWLPAGRRVGEELLMYRTLAERVGLALEAALLFEEVVRARRLAEDATAAESDFLAMVSHELRTPLTAIISYSELLEDRSAEMPPKLARYAHQIAGAAQHQRELVEQILSYKQVQREDAGAAEPEELDFRDVVQFAVAMVKPQAEGKPVEVVAALPAAAVPGVCDPGKLRQILANLLSNAIRHTDSGHVRLSLHTEDDQVVIRVEDTGEGIPEADLGRIFDRFWRGPAKGAERRGSGLGLTITRELVRRMNGEIQVESEPGAGSIFTVRIPRVATGESK